MNKDFPALTWPASRLGELLKALARTTGLRLTGVDVSEPPRNFWLDAGILDQWIESAAGTLGLEAEPVETSYAELDNFLRRAGPAILRWRSSETHQESPRFLALLGGRREVSVIAPDLKIC